MKAIYRSYEVLIEETAEFHKTRVAKKTTKQFRPSHANTARAIGVTHELFQDAVCYYILCIIGLIRDRQDSTNEPVNRLWQTINNEKMRGATGEVVRRLAAKFPAAPFSNAKDLEDFQKTLRAWCLERGGDPSEAALADTYRILFSQASKDADEDEEESGLENLKAFAGTWVAILCNEDGDTTLPGQGVYDDLHRRIGELQEPTVEAIWSLMEPLIEDANKTRTTQDVQGRENKARKAQMENAKRKNPKSADEVAKLSGERWTEAVQAKRDNLKAATLKAWSGPKTQKYCSLSPTEINEAVARVRATRSDSPSFVRLRYSARDNSMEQPIFRFIWHREDAATRTKVLADLLAYVAGEKPEKIIADDSGTELKKLPYQATGKEPLFPYFTNCLGVDSDDRAVWFDFDKSAFKRAAEEVFKYRVRTNARRDLAKKRRELIDALNGRGEWQDEKGKTRRLGGIEGDTKRPALMEDLLKSLGGALGYRMRRATIGGWTELRLDFLKAAKNIPDVDDEDLLPLVDKAQAESSGGFGSAPLFRKLCDDDYHRLWLRDWENKEDHHPKNFVRWWVRYQEALADLAKVEDPKTREPMPISFSWPGQTGSFRPLDFDCRLEPSPPLCLFDRDRDNSAVRLVEVNAKAKKSKKDLGPFVDKDSKEPLYPLTLSYRRLKRDRFTDSEGKSVESQYATPLIARRKEEGGDGAQPEFNSGPAFPRKAAEKRKSLEVSASLLPPPPPPLSDGCWHLTLAFKVEREMLKAIQEETPDVPGEASLKPTRDVGVYSYFRWPEDQKTEAGRGEKRKRQNPGSKPAKQWSAKKIWAASDFHPFDVVAVDLGVRFAGAWCRARISQGAEPPERSHRVISRGGDERKVFFSPYDFGTFRLQGEDVKIWRKDKLNGYGKEAGQEKYGSRGRLASAEDKETFTKLAKAVFPVSPRFPVSETEQETKFFPSLAEHLAWRLQRRLSRVRFLFKLRWQAEGRTDRFDGEYREATEKERPEMLRKNRYKAIESLAVDETRAATEKKDDGFMDELRTALALPTVWGSLKYEHAGKSPSLFAKVKGGTKADRKARKKAQSEAQSKFRATLGTETTDGWDWIAFAGKVRFELRSALGALGGERGLIAKVAAFVWPQRDREWTWTPWHPGTDGKPVQSLLTRSETVSESKKPIAGMRGLNMKRIRLLQDLRQSCQSLAKLERRYYGNKDSGLEPMPGVRDEEVHDPAPTILEKVDQLREQRTKQTAHMILAEALGLELMNPAEVSIDGKAKAALKSERDIHGRYQPRKLRGKNVHRVAAIIVENLSRYRTNQDRSRYENSELMEWSHREIIAKLCDLAAVFGIPIITVDARFSSRFSSRTGVPGIRCDQVARDFELSYPWKRWAEETKSDNTPTERAEFIRVTAKALRLSGDPSLKLVLPMDGGPAFLPVVPHRSGTEGIEENADINAAVSLALRAVAHPDRLDVFPVLKTDGKKDGKLVINQFRGSLSEHVADADARLVQPVELATTKASEASDVQDDDEDDDEEKESSKSPYLYAAVKVNGVLSLRIRDEERYQLPLSADGKRLGKGSKESVSAATRKVYWSGVKDACWRRIAALNAARVAARGVPVPEIWRNAEAEIEEDQIPL